MERLPSLLKSRKISPQQDNHQAFPQPVGFNEFVTVPFKGKAISRQPSLPILHHLQFRRGSQRTPQASQGGWVREANTIVLVGFGEQPSQISWYNRTVLGAKFGADCVDEDIRDFILDDRQEEPVGPVTQGSYTRHTLHDGNGPEPFALVGPLGNSLPYNLSSKPHFPF